MDTVHLASFRQARHASRASSDPLSEREGGSTAVPKGTVNTNEPSTAPQEPAPRGGPCAETGAQQPVRDGRGGREVGWGVSLGLPDSSPSQTQHPPSSICPQASQTHTA